MSQTKYLTITKLESGLRQPEVRVNEAFDVFDAIGGPKTRVYHNANQSIANATNTALSFNSERFDTDLIHDTSTNNSRLICKTAGSYLIVGTILFAANATGFRQAAIRINGSDYIAIQNTLSVGGSDQAGVTVCSVYSLAVSHYAELIAYQNSTGSLDVVSAGNYSPEFMMVRLGS